MKGFVLTLVCWLCISLPVSAQEQLRFGYIEFAPAFYTSPTGQPKGDLIKTFGKIAQKAGFYWTAKSYPTPRLLRNLQTGDVDVTMLVRHPLFENAALMGDLPVGKIRLRAYRKPDQVAVTKLTDLQGKSIITILGYGYGGQIKYIDDPANRIEKYAVLDHGLAVKMLLNGRADYLLDYVGPVQTAMEHLKINPAQVQGDVIQDSDVFLIVSKSVSNPEQLLRTLQVAYQGIQ
ncbi:hypothetical protein [Terasakiella sp. SH-1]|uniref:substrate-binding periplasmic protein n=1 Tax=Terasakiella sp. SH-1 TaxID=2560057 RepID=UPI001074054A|nr:hypothetical protein [Terasakiella sp. SH-1]